MSNKILLVFEGEKTESLVANSLIASLIEQTSNLVEAVYKTHIYNLKSYKGMKITESLVSSTHRKRYRKIVNVMRLTIVFCLLSLFCVHAESTY